MKRGVLAWLCTVALELAFGLDFSSVTDQLNLQDVSGQIAAFADFNADKATDILVLNVSGPALTMYLWDSGNNTFRRNDLHLQGLTSAIIAPAVNVADFDGDGIVDLLTLSGGAGPCHTPTVHWMAVSDGRVEVENYTVLPALVRDPPLVLDANGDHVPDIFTAICTDKQLSLWYNFSLWYSQGPKRTFAGVTTSTSLEYVSSYFVDLNSDCLADLVIDGRDSAGRRILELWEQKPNTGGIFSPTRDRVFLSFLLGDVEVIENLSFADMDGDGVLELVFLSCNHSSCTWPSVNILYQQKFPGTDALNCRASSSWKLNFTHVVSVNLQGHVSHQAMQPMIGDINLDGRPDVITVLSTDRVSSEPLFLLSVPCESGLCNGSTITLQPQQGLLPGVGNTSHVTLFDLWEDGILDVLVCEWGTGEGGGGGIAAFRQTLSEDHTFLKVVVLSGHCFSHCRAGVEPYGSLLPGAVVTFSTTDRNGREERNTAVIHPGSPYQLPFIVFGLGETPNFIEDLTIGAGHALGSNGSNRTAGYHQWASLVPNSQVIVITTPPDNPGRWRLELYLTPSHLVYSTAGVLCGLSVGIAMLVALLHAREKYQDSRERRQAKHRFHFNAM